MEFVVPGVVLPVRKPIRLRPSIYRTRGHVFSVTIGTSPRSPIFEDIGFGMACIKILDRLSRERGNPVLAYCLMPDHVHLLIETGGEELPAFVGAWKSHCYREWRARGGITPFWQRSYFDHALRRSEDVIATAQYILGNPVRAGLAEDHRNYPLCGSLVLDL